MWRREFSRNRNSLPVLGQGSVSFASPNLFTKTQAFDNAAWTKGNAAVTADSATAPDGTTTADTLTDNATAGAHYAGQVIGSFDARVTFNASFHMKQGTSRYANIFIGDNAAGAVFDLQLGTVVFTSGVTAGVVAASNGFFRCYIVGASDVASDGVYAAVNQPGTSAAFPSYSGAGSTVFLWGAQVTAGSGLWAYKAVA